LQLLILYACWICYSIILEILGYYYGLLICHYFPTILYCMLMMD